MDFKNEEFKKMVCDISSIFVSQIIEFKTQS